MLLLSSLPDQPALGIFVLHPHFKTIRKVHVHQWTQCVNTFKLLKEFYMCNQYMRFGGVICFRIYILFHSKRKINLANTIIKCYYIYTCNTIYFRYMCFLCQEKNTKTEKNPFASSENSFCLWRLRFVRYWYLLLLRMTQFADLELHISIYYVCKLFKTHIDVVKQI